MPLQFSIKTNLILTIVLVGLLGLGLALTSSNIYRDVILDYKRQSISDLLELKTGEQFKQLEGYIRDLANSLKGSAEFRQALANKNQDKLQEQLEQQFHQYFVTANILRLERLLLFTPEFELLAASSAGNTSIRLNGSICPQLIEKATQRRGAARLQIISTLCNNGGHPYYVLLLPVGGLVPKGYLEIMTSPIPSLQPIENELGMPLQIYFPGEQELYRSDNWPSKTDNGLIGQYQLTTNNDESSLVIEVFDDTRAMYQELGKTRNTIMLISAIVITLVTLIALFLLRRTLVNPLQALNHHLQRLHANNKLLGEPITTQSNIIEVNQLVDDYNMMAAELHNLQGRLERMAYTDPMTKLPNRGLFNDYVDYLLSEYNGSGRRFALFLIDLDEFKQVNDQYGHESGDMLLCETASRMNAVLRTPSFNDNKGISLANITNHDLLVRLGGDEFAVVLPDIENTQQVTEIAEKLVAATRSPVQLYNAPLSIHLSMGITLYPDDGSGRTSLLRRADAAMYHAKHHDHDFCFYHHAMLDAGHSQS